MKFKVLQEIVNKRYNVYERENHPLYKCFLDLDKYYFVDYEYELIDRELLCELEKYDIEYKIGDKIWIDDIPYPIKQIKYEKQGIKLYIDKQRIVKEINKKESEELLKEIKIKQNDLINAKKEAETRCIEKEKEYIRNQYNQSKTKNFIHKIKKYLGGDN